MPKLLIFAPCEKVIVNHDDRTLSLISILEGVNATVPQGITVSPDEIYPKAWVIVASWRRTPEDDNRHFEQLIQILLPNGDEALKAISILEMTNRDYRLVINVDGFIVGRPGEHILRLSLREVGTNADWTLVAEYPLAVTHSQVTSDNVDSLH